MNIYSVLCREIREKCFEIHSPLLSSITNSTRPFSKLRTAQRASSPIEQINVTDTDESENSDNFFVDIVFPAAEEILLHCSINFDIF